MSLFAQARVVESPPMIIVSGIVSVEGKTRDEYPLVQSRCHYNIVDVYSIAELVQDYHSSAPVSRDVEYVFPLPPGGAVCSFKAVIDEKKVIKGVVKEKATAKAQYQEAVAQGKTAGLLEQEHADVFRVSLGNIRPNQKISVHISFVSIISHDGSSPQAIRITMPTAIAPRYGVAPTTVPWFVANTHNRFDLTVAIQMNKPVTSVSSPSHPIGLTLGCNERELKGEYEPCKAFVSLGASTFLDSDIVIVISAQGLETPRCSVERWLASEGAEEITDAYAFTFVPKFDLPALPSQEYIFLVDRSGSMWGGRMNSVKASLQIMLRSLPSENTTFNIVSFGDKYTTMWPNSQPYSAESVEEASKQVDTFKADYGGTELRSAIDFSFRNRVSASSSFKDKTPTAVFVLTDGETWDLDRILQKIRSSVKKAKENDSLLRVFVLGIGNQVSTAMCEGMARAGKGSAVFVREGEKPDSKLMGLLRAARGGVIEDLAIEWGIGVDNIDDMETGDDFEVVQIPNEVQPPANALPLNLFDFQSKETIPNLGPTATVVKLPPPPVIQQAPKSDKLPIPLYPGFRCSIFAIVKQGLNPKPHSSLINITGKVLGRDVTLQVPVDPVDIDASATQDVGVNKLLHTLAGKALIQLFEDMPSTPETRAQIERLGKRYSLASSVTSFLAIDEESHTEKEASIEKVVKPAPKPQTTTLFGSSAGGGFGSSQPATTSPGLFSFSKPPSQPQAFSWGAGPKPGGLFAQPTGTPSLFGSAQPAASTGGLFGGSQPAATNPSVSSSPKPSAQPQTFSWGASPKPGGLFAQPTGTPSLFGSSQPAASTGGLFGGKAAPLTALFGTAPTATPPQLGNTTTVQSVSLFGSSQPSIGSSGTGFSMPSAAPASPSNAGSAPSNTNTTGAFGNVQSSGDSSVTSTANTNPFLSLFPSAAASVSVVGSPPNPTNPNTGLFGSSQPTGSSTASGTTGGFSAFANPSTTPSAPAVSAPRPATSTGLFEGSTGTGNINPPDRLTSLGNPPNAGTTPTFGSSPSNTNTGLFGSSQTVATSTTAKPFGGFGTFGSSSEAAKTSTSVTPPIITNTSSFGSSAGFGSTSPFGAPSPLGTNTSSTTTFGSALGTTSTSPFGSSQPAQHYTTSSNSSPFGGFGSALNTGSPATFGSAPSSQSSGPFGDFKPAPTGFGGASIFGKASAFGSAPSAGNTNPFATITFGSPPVAKTGSSSGLFGSSAGVGTTPAFGNSSVNPANPSGSNPFGGSTTTTLSVEVLARAQKFDGSFPADQELIHTITSGSNPLPPPALTSLTGDEARIQIIWVTFLAIACMEKRLADEKDVWEFLADKARNYVLIALRGIFQDSVRAEQSMKEIANVAHAVV